MSRWTSLREEIDRARREQPRYDLTRVTGVIKRLGDRGFCDKSAKHWLSEVNGPKGMTIRAWSRSANAFDNRGHHALRLRALRFLADTANASMPDHLRLGPVLSLRVVMDRAGRLREFSVGIDGACRGTAEGAVGSRWYARVDLTETPEGQGDCGHPLLHAHIGDDPDAVLSPRAPLPWMLPHEALEWLLATVDPALEPAP